MSGEGRRRADVAEVSESRGGTTALVCGSTSQDAACRRLARAGPGRAFRVRATTSGPPDAHCTDTDDQYETGVYDDLAVPDAGIAVSDTIANLGYYDGALEPGKLVVCVDGLSRPADRSDRRDLFQFLHAITHRVRDVDGHCHVHVPVEVDAHVTEVVAPLFDYVVDAGAVEESDR